MHNTSYMTERQMVYLIIIQMLYGMQGNRKT